MALESLETTSNAGWSRMIRRELLDPNASMWDLLAVYLHFLRTKHKLSCAKVGEVAGAARQTVSHWESGRLKPSEDQVEALDQRYGTGGLLGFILHHAKTGHDPDWFRAHLEFEARASALRIYELGVMPGLLQIEEYARALFVAAGSKDVDGQVAKRMERQRLLTKEDPPLLWILLAEPVLDWEVGGADVLRKQLARLLQITERPNVVLRVVPKSAGAHLGLSGAFKIMKVAGANLAYTEAMGGGRLVQGASEVGVFEEWYDRIGAKALPECSSRSLITRKLEINS
ncbi:helix-turn-helix transcriptional regulator [Spirillospora sp. NPDC048911]|uniref:helix-turn-helix domain-containing protein n=1 Tax=Spirillospora sp. NPDC048911 TaxID=3364527 RepID=UPI003720DECA